MDFLRIASVLFSAAGFWELVRYFLEKRSVRTQLLIGIAHQQLVQSCEYYIDRGYITSEEYDNLEKYLYLPYKKLGGNGLIDKLFTAVSKLPLTTEQRRQA